YGNDTTNLLCGNGYFSSSNSACNTLNPTTATSGYCFYGDITCSSGSELNGASGGTLYGNGYTPDNSVSDSSGTCFYGDISCSDGSNANGSSITVYGNGYNEGTTCYSGDWACGDDTYSNGTTCALACSGDGSTCCPSQGTYTDTVTCSGSGCGSSVHNRDDDQAYCEASSSGCTIYDWVEGGESSGFGEYTTGSETECCGDDSGENYATRTADASMDNNWMTNTSDKACCNANKCIANGNCYANESHVDVDGDGDTDYCLVSSPGTWYDCQTDADCSGGDDCISGECVDAIDLTYVYPTPAHDSRQVGNSVTINVTVNDTDGNNIDTCMFEWNGVNETMNKVGSGTYVTCYITKVTTDGSNYTFRVSANDSIGADEFENERNFTENDNPSITGILLNITHVRSGDHINIITTGAGDTNGDSYTLSCGNESGKDNYCNSTLGTGERSCTFSNPWGDENDHTIFCRLNDTYEISNDVSVNFTADNSAPTPNPAQILSVVTTTTSATVTAQSATDS
ncbi:MAG: hypothetical protein KAS32_07965, partial [Candidatus Peribacteraceae bacterium]|nr:hypothetical protein [Candidatus Peribacteraceae bacterium]